MPVFIINGTIGITIQTQDIDRDILGTHNRNWYNKALTQNR